MEGAYLPHAAVALEVLEDHLRDHEAGARLGVAHRGVGVRHGCVRRGVRRGSFLGRGRRVSRAAAARGLRMSAAWLFLAGCVARRPFRGARGLTLRAVVRTDDVTNRDRVSAADLQGLRKPYESTDHARCGSAAVGWLTTAKTLCSEPGFPPVTKAKISTIRTLRATLRSAPYA